MGPGLECQRPNYPTARCRQRWKRCHDRAKCTAPNSTHVDRAWTEPWLYSLAVVSGWIWSPNVKTPSQTLRVARGPTDVRPVFVRTGCRGMWGTNGQHLVSVGGWVPTAGLTNKVFVGAPAYSIVLWFKVRHHPDATMGKKPIRWSTTRSV